MPIAPTAQRSSKARSRSAKGKRARLPFWRRALIFLLLGGLAVYGVFVLVIASLRSINPWTTAVQTERHLAALAAGQSYWKQYRFVPLADISPSLEHAVIAAEDTRFYRHHGFDWQEVGAAIQEDIEGGRRRGASTLTQQLVRNLFLTTSASALRKVAEFSLVPPVETLLSKDRILELYLNVVEWGPGIYGAEAAARAYYHVPARKLSEHQSLELASILPAPLHRRPGTTEWYVTRIRARMQAMRW